MKNIKVENMTSPNGNDVPNQFIITTPDGVYFQSYDSIIAFRSHREEDYSLANGFKIVLDENYWNYSNTTGKYRNLFLGEDRRETERKIKAGIYQLADLNN